MIKTFILILFCSVMQINAQELNRAQLDSVYNLYTYLRGVSSSNELKKQIEIDPAIRKCGMGLVEEIKSNLSSFTIEQQAVFSKILQRPSLPNTLISPNGFFIIHYAITGTDAIGYDVNLLAQALDSSYNFEVNYLGYPPPPADGVEGGDGRYDVYVRNLGNLYGQTTSESKVGASNWTSFLEIDNDFAGFFTQGINAARVTVAHEFHHAIQMGNYAPGNGSSAIRSSDTYFYEITSTSMEEFVYSSVNDYYAYMADYFRNPERPIPLNNGYNLAIWNIFLKDNFGFGVIKRQWEMMPTTVALNAINQSIIEKSSNFGFELNTFGIWTYFTSNRSITGKYFEEAVNYPLITPTTTVTFSTQSQKYDMTVGPTGNYFLKINLPSSDGTLFSIISNSDVQQAISNSNQTFDFSYSIYSDINSGNKILNNKYSVTFSRENQTFWNNTGILNDIIVYGDSSFTIPNIEKEVFSYPAPFRYSTDNGTGITIAFQSNASSNNELDFNVYTSAMNLVYIGKLPIGRSYSKNSKNYFEFTWNALDNNKNYLASGVYVFFIKVGSEIKKGKLVIFND
jgi:hypothetical protein